jgi:hypothetical protein
MEEVFTALHFSFGLAVCRGLHFSGLDEKSRVENPRPVPAFSIPDKIPNKNYAYFIALNDQNKGNNSQQLVAHLMNEKTQQDSLHFVLTLGDNFYNDGMTSIFDKQ